MNEAANRERDPVMNFFGLGLDARRYAEARGLPWMAVQHHHAHVASLMGECGLVFVRNQGDIWLFWILMDRVPLFIGIVLIYFGFQITHWSIGLLFFLGMAGPLVATMPHRQGVAIALSYLSRVYFRDPSDELPGRGL